MPCPSAVSVPWVSKQCNMVQKLLILLTPGASDGGPPRPLAGTATVWHWYVCGPSTGTVRYHTAIPVRLQ